MKNIKFIMFNIIAITVTFFCFTSTAFSLDGTYQEYLEGRTDANDYISIYLNQGSCWKGPKSLKATLIHNYNNYATCAVPIKNGYQIYVDKQGYIGDMSISDFTKKSQGQSAKELKIAQEKDRIQNIEGQGYGWVRVYWEDKAKDKLEQSTIDMYEKSKKEYAKYYDIKKLNEYENEQIEKYKKTIERIRIAKEDQKINEEKHKIEVRKNLEIEIKKRINTVNKAKENIKYDPSNTNYQEMYKIYSEQLNDELETYKKLYGTDFITGIQ